ncbi:MAG: transcriptional regulator, TetR family [Alphaproteobacteria bacterium]|nr:transcriptional regulator, TetR family [Alphaproteobacteria bacterium]
MAVKEKRVRRKPEEARALILDAAEKSMAEGGPAGIRLQDVARIAGVSHPTILHHFGSRDGLVRALNLRTLEDFKAALLANMKATTTNGDDGIALSFAMYRNGLAQRMLWHLQANTEPEGRLDVFDSIVTALHEMRKSFALPGHEPDLADTRNVVHLVTVAAMGDALIGARLRNAGEKEREAGAAFEKWLSDLITLFMRSKV